jgi:hypothetical protein
MRFAALIAGSLGGAKLILTAFATAAKVALLGVGVLAARLASAAIGPRLGRGLDASYFGRRLHSRADAFVAALLRGYLGGRLLVRRHLRDCE